MNDAQDTTGPGLESTWAGGGVVSALEEPQWGIWKMAEPTPQESMNVVSYPEQAQPTPAPLGGVSIQLLQESAKAVNHQMNKLAKPQFKMAYPPEFIKTKFVKSTASWDEETLNAPTSAPAKKPRKRKAPPKLNRGLNKGDLYIIRRALEYGLGATSSWSDEQRAVIYTYIGLIKGLASGGE